MLVDHVAVLLFLWRPNRGGLAVANALATAGGRGVRERRLTRGEVKEESGEDFKTLTVT